jgi:uncharacterized protein
LLKIDFRRLSQYPAPIRLGSFVLALLLLWLPFAVPIRLLVADDNLVTILTMPLLYAEFILLLRFWGKHVHEQPKILQHYGLETTRHNGVDLLRGLAIGLISILILFATQGILGWLVWQKPSVFLLRFIAEGLIVALAYGFAEELLFRGWLLDELQRDYSRRAALGTTAVIFATLHFSLAQFPALLVLGLTLVWAKRWRRGRLGMSMGVHGGLIWGYYIINVGQLIEYTGAVPEFITGVNKNPMAGVMGFLFLGVLALWMGKKASTVTSSPV